MKQKRILFLGGAYAQMPIIEEAKNRGWYIITCDYLPNNPGHKLSDEYYNISTTDQDKVLKLAQKIRPDFVVAYASDPAAPVAAYVSEKLGLPGNSYASVQLLSEKDKFRSFLSENGFNTPAHISIEGELDYEALNKLQFPVIVKPTDSSGSKGVSKVDKIENMSRSVEYALQFSRNKRVIVEEFIEAKTTQLHGDGFVQNGRLVFCYLGEHHYKSEINQFVPFSTTWPNKIDGELVDKINEEIAKAIKLSGFSSGAINIEVRFTKDDKIYIMEIGPRSGGNFVPQVINYSTGFNMVKATLNTLSGEDITINKYEITPAAYYVIHSANNGILDSITISDELRPYINEYHQYIQSGENVRSFQGANAAIGIILLTFPDTEIMDKYIKEMGLFVNVKLK